MSNKIKVVGVNGEDWICTVVAEIPPADLLGSSKDTKSKLKIKKPLRVVLTDMTENGPVIGLMPTLVGLLANDKEFEVTPSYGPIDVDKKLENAYLSSISGIQMPTGDEGNFKFPK